MRPRNSILAVTGLALALIGAGGCMTKSGEGDAPPTTRRDTPVVNDDNPGESAGTVDLGPVVSFSGLSAQVPTDWQSEAPSSPMRKAQFVLPGAEGAGDASLVVYDFGAGQGGGVLDNLARWRNQVTDDEGTAVTPTVVESTVAGMSITKSEATGNYASGMPGDDAVSSNTTVINVQLIKSTEQNIFFKLVGPKETVAAHRAGFEAMLGSIKVDQ